MANASKDFEELLEALNKWSVEYLIVGGYALAIHGFARFTKDLDIFFNTETRNAKNLYSAVKEFIGEIGLKIEDFTDKDAVIQIGYEPVRVDLIASIDGVTFNKAWKNKIKAKFGTADAYFISKADLIKNKSATGREQDALDVKNLKSM